MFHSLLSCYFLKITWNKVSPRVGTQILFQTHCNLSNNLIVTLRVQIHTYLTLPVWYSLSGTQFKHLSTELANYNRKFIMFFLRWWLRHVVQPSYERWTSNEMGQSIWWRMIGHVFWRLFLNPHLIIYHSNTSVIKE